MSIKASDVLSENNISVTLPRLIIIEEMLAFGKPITIELLIKKVGNKVATSTLYRVLKDFKNKGILEEFTTPENDTVVELSLNEHDHHHHVFCSKCGEAEDITLSEDIEKQLGVEILNKDLWLKSQPNPVEVHTEYDYDFIKKQLQNYLNPGSGDDTPTPAAPAAPAKSDFTLETATAENKDTVSKFDDLFNE